LKSKSSTLLPNRALWPFIVVLFLLFGNCAKTSAFAPPQIADMPKSITVGGQVIALKDLKNPLRSGNSDQLAKNIHEGGKIYFKNCFLCHGDLLDGRGIFGESFTPPPADFTHPESILSKPEPYAFWRIAKGGKGLPAKFSPWDSAMPAWENQLEVRDIWKVVLFIYETADERVRPPTQQNQEPTLEAGKEIYKKKCAYCHGESGDGKGVAAEVSSPRPRNFIKGQYKFRSVKFGKIPTDQDLYKMIANGMPNTTMPSWKHLPEADRWSLVLYLKSLSKKFAKAVKKNRFPKVIPIPDPPAEITVESIASGKELFLQNCSGCHGVKGRSGSFRNGNAPVFDPGFFRRADMGHRSLCPNPFTGKKTRGSTHD
jgi:mono/diheme cytochrome c family protein